MNRYIGTKIINAQPMTRASYNAMRGWTLPADENGDDEGYLVEYTDGGQANHPDFQGYVSWSPRAQFEGAYRSTTGLTFGMAIEALKAGQRVARTGWNGKGMWLSFNKYDVGLVHLIYGKDGLEYAPEALPWIGMKTADNKYVPWLASQTDVLAEDYFVVE